MAKTTCRRTVAITRSPRAILIFKNEARRLACIVVVIRLLMTGTGNLGSQQGRVAKTHLHLEPSRIYRVRD